MTVLHLCHWQSLSHFKLHASLLRPHHTLLIYGQISADDLLWLAGNMREIKQPWYLVIERPNPHIDYEIDSNQWLQLITDHEKTLTWK